MNEVEKHYAGVGEPGGTAAAGSEPQPSGAAKGRLDAVASTAREGMKSATDAARSAGETAREALDRASDWGRDSYRSTSRTISDARRRSAAQFATGRRGVEEFVEENPIMVGVAGLAAGLLLGALLPGTQRENRVFGRYADEMRDQGLRYARELAEQGKTYVEENLAAGTQRVADRDTGDETRAG